jgi:outer membrane protein
MAQKPVTAFLRAFALPVALLLTIAACRSTARAAGQDSKAAPEEDYSTFAKRAAARAAREKYESPEEYYRNFSERAEAQAIKRRQRRPPANPSGEPPRYRPQSEPKNALKLEGPPPLNPVKEWTLQAAIDRALEASPDLLQARVSVERQIGQRLVFTAALLPRITATGSYAYRTSGLIDRSPGEELVPPSNRTSIAQASYDMNIEIRYLAFNGFGNFADARGGRLAQERAVWQLEDTAYRTVALVRQAYYAVLLRRKLQEVQQEALSLVRRQLDISEKRFAAGEIAEFDTLRVRTEIASAEADAAEALDNASASAQVFNRLLQLPDSGANRPAPLALAGDLKPVPFDLPFEQAVERARNKRNDLIAARLQIDIADAGVTSAIARFLPTLEIYANEGLRSSYFSSGFDRHLSGATAGVSAQWAIFDGLANAGRLRSARADRATAKIQLSQLEQTLTSTLRDLYSSVERGRSLIASQTSAAGYARKSLEQAQRLYQLGGAQLDDVLNSRLALTRAEVALQQAIFNYNTAVAQAEYAASLQKPLPAPSPPPKDFPPDAPNNAPTP